jgi:hypothetical protein
MSATDWPELDYYVERVCGAPERYRIGADGFTKYEELVLTRGEAASILDQLAEALEMEPLRVEEETAP